MNPDIPIWPPKDYDDDDDDDKPPEIIYNKKGRIVGVPEGWVVAYYITYEGYSGSEHYDLSETYFGEPGMGADEIRQRLLSDNGVETEYLYGSGKGVALEPSISEAAISEEEAEEEGGQYL